MNEIKKEIIFPTMPTIPKALQSSDNNGKLSTTIQGLIVLCLVYIAKQYDIPLTVEAVTEYIGTVITIYGLLKKIYNKKNTI